MHYYKFHIGDYLTHTTHLSPNEDLIYRRLIDYYYLHEKPIPLNEPEKYIRLPDLPIDVERVLSMFFKRTKRGWINERCDQEIFKFSEKICKASVSGRISGERRRQKSKQINSLQPNERSSDVEQPLSKRETNLELTTNQEPLTKNHKPIISRAPKVFWTPPAADQFLDIMPDKLHDGWIDFFGENWKQEIEKFLRWHEVNKPNKTKRGWLKAANNWLSGAQK
jgi:uncharacterized protein YdaU (DUF1376 family)